MGTRMNMSAGSRPLRWAVLFLLVPLLLGGCSLFARKRPRAPYKKLSPPIAYEMMRDNPEMLVLDLRPPQEFNGETGHIRRARNIPLERLPFRMLEISAFREDTVLVYCRNDDCGEKGIGILLSSGFENIVLMEGGIDKWIRDGFRTVLPSEVAGRTGLPVPDDGKGPVMPLKPGKPSNEVTVEPPPVPPPPPPGPALGTVAAPRQIG